MERFLPKVKKQFLKGARLLACATLAFGLNAQSARASGLESSELGIQIDSRHREKIPSAGQLDILNPGWIRFVYTPDHNLPNIQARKFLVVFNSQSTRGLNVSPFAECLKDEADLPYFEDEETNKWIKYTNCSFLPALKNFEEKYPFISAVEIWNEEDVCSETSCTFIPPQAYAFMLKESSSIIKNKNSNTNVIMGGLGSGQTSYIEQVQSADPMSFSQVDAIGVHLYGKSPSGWGSEILKTGDLAEAVEEYRGKTPLDIWVTEIGYGTDDKEWQGEFLQKSLEELFRLNVSVIIWYSGVDGMTGTNGKGNWGLIDRAGNLKPAGIRFSNMANL